MSILSFHQKAQPPAPLVKKPVKGQPLLLVIPFYFRDAWLAVELLNWCAELDGKLNCECLLAFDEDSRQEAGPVVTAAVGLFKATHLLHYPSPRERVWPRSNNHMFTHVANHVSRHFPHSPWLLLETDTVPLRPGWFGELQREYWLGDKPFMGHVVDGMGHMNGQGIYPPSVSQYTRLAFNCPDGWAWDIAMRPETEAFTHDAKKLIGHIWNMGKDGNPVMSGDGICPSFKDQATVDRFICPEAATFHRCKDATLIHRLRERRQN
jgi:hypothetical protein